MTIDAIRARAAAHEEWQRIEGEARAVAIATLEHEETAPLALGSLVAWSENRFARTDGFSLVHRAGEPTAGALVTLCGEAVPAPIQRVPLSAALVRSLGRCRYCDERYANKERAA